jgi:branched-chain amino acid transport system substrate-binding protein
MTPVSERHRAASRRRSRAWSVKLLIAVMACVLVGAMLAPSGGTSTRSASLVPDNGPCAKSKPAVQLGLITVFDSPVLHLKDQADAAVASVAAFNKRGGVGGHCLKLTTCDDGADPNQAADCARKMVKSKVVATINDTTAFGNQGVIDILKAGGVPRFEVSPGTEDLTNPLSYAIGAGGVGTTFMMAPPLLKTGHKKLYMIGVDAPAIGTLPPLMKPMVASYGAEILGLSKVPAGTTDYQQFVLAAQDAGADSVMLPLGDNEAIQVLQAAKQLNTKLDFSVSLGTFGKADIKQFGDFAKQIYFNAELPPVSGDQKTWPILKQVIADLSASGEPQLQKDKIKSSPFRSWIAVYHFVTLMGQNNPDNITRESVVAALNSAKDLDTFGLIPPWTPNLEGGVTGSAGALTHWTRISQPWYYRVTWNGKNFVVAKDRMNVSEEMGGNHTYAQPAA